MAEGGVWLLTVVSWYSRLTLVGLTVDKGPSPTLVPAMNPALALTVKLEKVSPPRSQPAAGRSVTSLTLMQLMASASGGAMTQPLTRRITESRRTFFPMRTSSPSRTLKDLDARKSRQQKQQPTCQALHGECDESSGG